MANGKIRFGKQSGGVLSLTFPDGVTNTEVVLPESGTVATQAYVDDLKIIATGTATFTSTTNNINLTGIGIGVEIGDVIQISGADDVKNNSEFTIEVITDADNIIVNQAHANKGTSKNIANRASDSAVTVTLLSKYYNADNKLGRDWVDVTSSRIKGTSYPCTINRPLSVYVDGTASSINGAITLTTSGIASFGNGASGSGGKVCLSKDITIGSSYVIGEVTSIITINKVYECR